MNEYTARGLHQARWVEYDEEMELLYAWHGGHTVNVWTLGGMNVDVFSAGSFEQNEATLEEIKRAISDHMAGDRAPATHDA
jgi:hypothetical protein